MFANIALIAYITDLIFGEFSFIKHPVVLMGEYIDKFEKNFYKDSILRGAILTLSLLVIVYLVSMLIEKTAPIWLLGILSSTGIASKMLYQSVKEIITDKQKIRFLVSRDTHCLNDSDINKAAIETYAENLNDGVIAPLFYLLLFGFSALFVYKAINTLDSMVGYKNDRYEKFGKFSARLDDAANFIPSRITAFLIALLFFSKNALSVTITQAKKHESPNAGYPIAAMAGALGVKLAGDTSYFGKIKKKPHLGYGQEKIFDYDIKRALSLQKKLDTLIIFILLSLFISTY